MVLTVFDASFAGEENMKSQAGYLNLITDTSVRTGDAVCNIAEFSSSTINRVVRSTMAAESVALSLAIDRQMYLRLIIECVLYGEPDLTKDWRSGLTVTGVSVTDAKSLYDHLTKTGSIPAERQTLIDLLVARDLHESESMELKWLPNRHMLADPLTKALTPNAIYDRFIEKGLYSVIPNEEEEAAEAHRIQLRQAQRERAKAKKKARREALDRAIAKEKKRSE